MNPLKDQIFKVFAQNKGRMNFEDYLNMMSVFSEAAPLSVKSYYAFKIFGNKFEYNEKKERKIWLNENFSFRFG